MNSIWSEDGKSAISDEKLMFRVRDADCVDSFRRLFDRWSDQLHRLSYRMTGNWEDAEEIVQDVFVRLFRNRARYVETAKFSTYLWQIAINRCRDHARSTNRQNIRKAEFLDGIGEASLVSQAEKDTATNELVQQALLNLQPHHREVVVLRHFENLKFNEIAELLDVPAGTVASRMATAMRRMFNQLATSEYFAHRVNR